MLVFQFTFYTVLILVLCFIAIGIAIFALLFSKRRHSGIYSRNGELNAVDESGNLTVISPHHFSLIEPSDPMAWSFYSKNESLNQQLNVDMMRVVRLVENLAGEQLIYKADLDGNILPPEEKENLRQLILEQQERIEHLELMVQQLLNKK